MDEGEEEIKLDNCVDDMKDDFKIMSSSTSAEHLNHNPDILLNSYSTENVDSDEITNASSPSLENDIDHNILQQVQGTNDMKIEDCDNVAVTEVPGKDLQHVDEQKDQVNEQDVSNILDGERTECYIESTSQNHSQSTLTVELNKAPGLLSLTKVDDANTVMNSGTANQISSESCDISCETESECIDASDDSKYSPDPPSGFVSSQVTNDLRHKSDETDSLISELESELAMPVSEPSDSVVQEKGEKILKRDNMVNSNFKIKDNSEGEIISSAETTGQGDLLPNGMTTLSKEELPSLQAKFEMLQKVTADKDIQIKRLIEEKMLISHSLQNALKEKDIVNERIKYLSEKITTQESKWTKSIKELEAELAREKQEHGNTQAKLVAQEAAAKKAFQQLQNDLHAKLTQVGRAYEDSKREKEGMVVKYAMAEQKNIEMEERMNKNNKRMIEMEKESNLAVNKFKTIRAEKSKMDELFGQRNAEVVSLRRDLERVKELRHEQELKTKWHTNKLKCELEAHKETKGKLDDALKRLKHAHDEAESIRKDTQNMIKQCQASEGQKSSTLESELRARREEVSEQQQAHSLIKNQLDTLQRSHKDMVEELRTAKDKVTCLEAERLHQEETLQKFKDTLQQQKQDNKTLHDRLAALEDIEQQLSIEKSRVAEMSARVAEVEEQDAELRTDMAGCTTREAEHLQEKRQWSDKHAQLLAQHSATTTQLERQERQLEQLQTELYSALQQSKALEAALDEERGRRIEEVAQLSQQRDDKVKAVLQLTQQLEDQRDENKTLKRRHQANSKDLHRQLQQLQRKLEKGSLCGDVSSMGSRTSSCNSLNTLTTTATNEQPSSGTTQTMHEQSPPLPQEPEAPLVQFVEVDKQVLVEKIVRLQKAHARKNEKIEFMEEHINQLVNELQKKTRIIQTYIMREEAGALAPEAMDRNKAQLARKGGIMASVWQHESRDQHLSLDLSLQINHKFQAVLEDTLLKNITLKENMETLGSEISELSKANRALQLRLQAGGSTVNDT